MKVEDKVHACPQCGWVVSRVHRHLGDRVVAFVERVYRYRCSNPECKWEGIVSLPSQTEGESGAGPVTWRIRVTWLLIGVAVAMVGVAGIKLYRDTRPSGVRVATAKVIAPLPVPAGEDFDGQSLPPDDARVTANPTDLSVRRECAWGVPGGNPYKGTPKQALMAARLPEEVVSKVGAMIEHGVISDRVVITRDSIATVSGKRRFDTTLSAMAFGRTVCFGTRVNFHPGHIEAADLYDATDASGTNFTIMVPNVCGNVSVITERHRPVNGNGKTVPEPGALASLIVGMVALAVIMRRRRRPA